MDQALFKQNYLLKCYLRSLYITSLVKAKFKKSLKKKLSRLNWTSCKALHKTYSLNITFRRRNTFFVIVSPYGSVIKTTSVRREGFKGRSQRQYGSMEKTIRQVKTIIEKFRIRFLNVTFLG
jgi:hypothetical protein